MNKRGFTLIELLVVAAIISLLTTVSLAGWGRFRDKKTIEGMGKEISTQLKEVRSRAVNGEKPPGCTVLDGYQVDNTLFITACCDNDNQDDRTCHEAGGRKPMADKLSMDLDNFSLSYRNFPVIFRVLSGTVDAPAPTITLSYHNLIGQITITISESGEISWQET